MKPVKDRCLTQCGLQISFRFMGACGSAQKLCPALPQPIDIMIWGPQLLRSVVSQAQPRDVQISGPLRPLVLAC